MSFPWRLAAALLAAAAPVVLHASDFPAPAARDAVRAFYRGDTLAAVDIARRVLEREPDNDPVRIHLARVLRWSGRFDEALSLYDELCARAAPAAEVRIAAAETAVLAARPERALEYLRPADPSAETLYVTALALTDSGRHAEALSAFSASLALEPFRPIAWFQRAELQQEAGDLDGAEESFRKALGQEPNLTAAYLPLARISVSRGDTDKAAALLRRASASLPDDVRVRELLASLEAARPALVEDLQKARKERRDTATPRRAEALPADRAALPLVRVGLLERVRTAHFKTGGSFSLTAGGAVKDTGGPVGGVLAVRAVDGDIEVGYADAVLRVASPLRLTYVDPADATILFDVEYDRGGFWAGTEDRTYRGVMELIARPEGLTVVNELPIEEYLYSVLPSEMPASWPAAALRAQAVAARSYTMAGLGRFASRGFDLLGNVFSAAYRGMLAETPSVRAAVDATRGVALMDGEKPLAAYYSANSGGHSETARSVWGIESPIPALADPRLDAGAFPLPPDDLARWLAERPPTYSSQPGYSAGSAYRWKVWVPREEIEARVGAALGTVVAVEPLARGRSGRVSAVRVRGIGGERVLRGDAIRWPLGGLRSNLFVVEPKLGSDGLPQYFVFSGAGWGHGVGMCQSGAAGMAAQGMSTEQILGLYYGSAELRRLY